MTVATRREATETVRALRSAPAGYIAAAGGLAKLQKHVRRLRTRGGCAQTLADIASAAGAVSEIAAADRRCPPAAALLAMVATPSCGPRRLRGTLSWAAPSADAFNAVTDPAVCGRLMRRLAERRFSLREAITSNPSCPTALLVALTSAEDDHTKLGVAAHASCPAVGLAALSFDPACDDMAGSIAENEACPRPLLTQIVAAHSLHGSSCEISEMVAGNPNCAPDLVERFARHSDWAVRCGAASNPACDPSVLEMLAGDDSESVRSTVARNPSCGVGLAQQLAADPNWEVRQAAAANPDCAPALAEQLAADQNFDVRASVASNPNCEPEILRTLAADLHRAPRRQTAANPNCDPGTVERLARDDAFDVRATIAWRPDLTQSLAEQLAADPERRVRNSLARNPICGPALAEQLAVDSDWKTRASVARNHNCAPAVLDKLAHDTRPAVVETVAENPSCWSHTLEHIAVASRSAVRTSVAVNPACPPQLLQNLATDVDVWTRRAAQTAAAKRQALTAVRL